MFTFQIYGDFSGYSDIAIGTARLFGINLMRNFNYPYFSRSIPEFWRRWHISLNTWFGDYVYIPLGGSRCVRWKVIRNTLIVFFVSGLWHGANWTFICWGLYHGLLFLPYLLLKKKTKFEHDIAENTVIPSLKEAMQVFVTFCLVVVGWILFRAQSIQEAVGYISRMFTDGTTSVSDVDKKTLIFICVLLICEWINRKKQFGMQLNLTKVRPIYRYSIYITLMFLILLFSGRATLFIYFQF
jgi:D-alanyl-lipoteichoic acid acyltransferase DltB (MBOAT superfamily)